METRHTIYIMDFNWDVMDALGNVNSHYAPAFLVSLAVCRASFHDDCKVTDKAHSLIFADIQSNQQIEWGSALGDQLLIWRENIPPTMPAL